MTQREIWLYAEGVNDRLREEFRQEITIAHLSAWLVRMPAKDFPKKASELFPRKPLTKKQQAAYNRTMIYHHAMIHGGVVEVHKKSKGRTKISV